MTLIQILCIISGVSFIIYGITHFTSSKMKNEFIRFNLEKFGIVTAIFELLGGAGLLIGFFYRPLLLISAGGLTILMFAGLIARINVKDSFPDLVPVLFFIILNSYIFYSLAH
jgi:uncharacterized membrane protein YphA (DoxX/SURF4 family)